MFFLFIIESIFHRPIFNFVTIISRSYFMSYFKEQLLGVLAESKGSGTFAGSGRLPFLFPGLEIDGIGEIGFPVSPLEINAVI